MSDYSRRLGRGSYGRWGQGQQGGAPPVEWEWASWSDFAGGLDLRDSRGEIPPNSSPRALDVEVTARDELRRAPGVLSAEQWIDPERRPSQIFLQASLDYTAELVMLDPPFLGVRREELTQWVDEGLEVTDEPYAHVNFGGTLVFSDGVGTVYKREADAGGIEVVEDAPPARSYANFAARIFAGNVFVDGRRQPLGIMWSGASSDPGDWFGAGSGYEILVGNQSHADKIVALRPLGFDMLAVLCRRSVWIGARTGILNRPADFQMRAEGPGALTDKVVSVLPQGVVYLSDGGVFLFDGNAPRMISEQINAELLPLDLSRVNQYSCYYHPGTKKFYLFTPFETWVLDLEKGRWLKRSLVARGAAIFGIQLDQVTWGELQGSWGEQEQRWGQFAQEQSDTYDLYVLTDSAGGVSCLGRESDAASSNIDLPLDPTWEFLFGHGEYMNQVGTYQLLLVECKGTGNVQFWLPDINGHLGPRVERQVSSPGIDTPSVVNIPFQYSGLGLGLKVRILGGFARLSKVQLAYTRRGPRLETGTFAPREYYEDFKG